MTVLRSSPYNLVFDSLIRVKLTACNLNGCGDESDVNTVGAFVQTEPEAVITMLEGLGTDESNIHVEW